MNTHDSAMTTLRAAINRMIPADEWPAGWEGGVEDYLTSNSGEAAWTVGVIPDIVHQLDEAARDQGSPGFAEADEGVQETALFTLFGAQEGRLLPLLMRIAFEGYYAQTKDRTPSGIKMVGFADVPAGVEPVELAPIKTTPLSAADTHYDAIIIGSGPGGGSAAWTLAEAGKRVLIVERSPLLPNSRLRGDHLRGKRNAVIDVTVGPGAGNPRVAERADGSEYIVDGDEDGNDYGLNAMTLGGGTRVWQGMAWRFMPEDFRMATTYGVPEGSSLADWPISYDDMEPFYGLAEHQLGVSGEEGALTARTPRTTPYPMPPMPSEPARVILGAAAERLGWGVGPVPFALNSVPHDGRPACVRCAQCVGHACPVNAKNGSHNTFLPRALAHDGCDLVVEAQAIRVEDGVSRALATIVAPGSDGPIAREISADVIIVSAGAVETPRLLLASGLGNDELGHHLHDHAVAIVAGMAPSPIKSFLGPGHSVATLDHVHSKGTPYGGGVLFDLNAMLPLTSAYMAALMIGVPWGPEHKRWLREDLERVTGAFSIVQEIPVATSRVSLSQRAHDRWGVPAAAFRKDVHQATRDAAQAMATHGIAWLEEAGVNDVTQLIPGPAVVSAAGEHSCGTARMSSSEKTGATAPNGRLYGTKRIFVSDSSLNVTNGSVNPALTIMANCLRVSAQLVNEWPRA